MYNWQQPEWPNFRFDPEDYTAQLESYVNAVRELVATIRCLEVDDAQAYYLERLVAEAVSTSGIEGEIINRQDLVSSITDNVNLGIEALAVRDVRATAVTRQLFLNQITYDRPLTETGLKYWHELLMGYDRTLSITGDYRQGNSPMRIVSGSSYRLQVHYEAPPSAHMPQEMKRFVAYCNTGDAVGTHPVLKAGIAHLYFENIHPFEDGNGRIGRALLETLLSQQLGTFVPYSISQAILARQGEYYTALQQSSTSLEIDAWLTYFCEVLNEAVRRANELVGFSLRKRRYFHQFAVQLNPHHRKVIEKMFATGPAGFQGSMTTRKYMRINRVSQATAARALRYLTSIGALTQHGAGRSTHYLLP